MTQSNDVRQSKVDFLVSSLHQIAQECETAKVGHKSIAVVSENDMEN